MAVEHLETERKFDVDEAFALPDLAAVPEVAEVREPVEHALEAAYYDTADLRLARARVTLRRRTGGPRCSSCRRPPRGSSWCATSA